MTLSEATLLEGLKKRLFAPQSSASPHLIGLEVELIPFYKSSSSRALLRGENSPGTADVLSQLGSARGWSERSAETDPPSWTLPDGSCISFEPGGQIEISSAPQSSVSEVVQSIHSVVTMVRKAMDDVGIELSAVGVDPCNDIDAVPLVLRRDRYVRMTHYFDSLGPSGVRMMRQTAAVQINIERGVDPPARWMLLNALAPYVTALFANSERYAGESSGHASFRAHLWRTLDRSRTGLPADAEDPARRYLCFALDAGAIRSSDGSRPWLTFRQWMQTGQLTEDDWIFHLSTLFPEVRPKEFFEIRSADAIDPDELAAPAVFITGIVYDDDSAARASKLVGSPSEELLVHAGQRGLSDPEIRNVVSQLAEMSLVGAERLGSRYISSGDMSIAKAFFDRATGAHETTS